MAKRGTVPAKQPRGRPTSLTPEVQEVICASIERGCFVETAVLVAGITKPTFYDWLRRGAKGEAPFDEFLNVVQEKIATTEMNAVEIGKTSDPWRWLSLRRRGRWGGDSRSETPKIAIDETSPPSEADPQFDPKRLTAVEQDEFLSMMSRFNELTAKGMPVNTTGAIDAEIVSP